MKTARCVEKLPHSCGSSNGLQVWYDPDTDKYSGWCFPCQTKVADPYGDNPPDPKKIKKKTPEEVKEELNTLRNCPFPDFEHRSIRPSSYKEFNVRVALSEFDGKTPNAMCYPFTKNNAKKLSSYKLKLITKTKDFKMWAVGDMWGVDPFNWLNAKKIGGKTLYITEGEEDAIALWQILTDKNKGTKYESTEYAVISLPSGADSVHDSLGPLADEISKRWQEIVLVYDQDKAGAKAIVETRKILPQSMTVKLPEKDVNKCLEEGRVKAVHSAVVFNATKPTPMGTLSFDDVIEDAMKPVEYGVSYPWEELTDLTYGQRKQELISIGGGTGTGKTLTGYELMAHNALEHGWCGLGIFMEASPREVLLNICGKVDSIPYHVPGTSYDTDQLRATAEKLNKYITLWNPEESGSPEENWEGMKSMIRSCGNSIDYVLLDNMTTLSEGMSSSERNDFIGKVSREAVDLAMKFDIEIIFYSHLNAPERNQKSHENGGKVLESQFTGSRALQRYSHMMMGFCRNKLAVDPSCSYISVLKNRKFGKTGIVKTYYNETTGKLIQSNWDGDQFKDRKVA